MVPSPCRGELFIERRGGGCRRGSHLNALTETIHMIAKDDNVFSSTGTFLRGGKKGVDSLV